MAAKKKHNPRHDTFVREYLKDFNGSRAAIAAGYGKKGARVRASQLLTNRNIQALLAKLIKKHAKKLDLTAGKVLAELSQMGFSNMLDYMRADEDGELVLDLSELTREQAAAIQEYTVDATGGTGDGERKLVMRTRFKLADKIKALELLGKYLKLFTERIEVTGLAGLAEAMVEAKKRADDGS